MIPEFYYNRELLINNFPLIYVFAITVIQMISQFLKHVYNDS